MGTTSNTFHKLILVVEGNGALEVDRHVVSLKPNTVVRANALTPHRFADEPAAPMTLAAFCFSPDATSSTLRAIWPTADRRIPLFAAIAVAPGHAAELCSLNREIGIEIAAGRTCSKSMIAALAQQAIVQFVRGIDAAAKAGRPVIGRQDTAFASTLLWLDRHFTQPLSIDELADRAGMSYRSFTHHFFRQTGSTVNEYVNRRRVDLAAHLMKTGHDILQAAFQSGFNDVSHFYRMFRRYAGTTPGKI